MSSPATITCPFCQADIGSEAKKCRHCGEWVARSCERCATPLRGEWAARGVCAECQSRRHPVLEDPIPLAQAPGKSRGIAAASAFFLGGLRAHRFYLGNYLAGLVYLVFCWTLIPSLAGMIEGIRFALMDDAEFNHRFP